tara:strand:+ start:299 stop:568 length:270 start_codon:yes stop_codon:yes gene_type:complete
MIYAKEKTMKNKKFEEEIKVLKEQIEKTKLEKNKLDEVNEKLQDEVDSLWAMMDEMTKSDVKNWTNILDKLEKDTVAKALMVTNKVADA